MVFASVLDFVDKLKEKEEESHLTFLLFLMLWEM